MNAPHAVILTRLAWIAAALITSIAATAVASRQTARQSSLLVTPSWAEWFFIPVESDPPLQSIDIDLRAVHAADAQHIWAVGNRGVIVHSNDGGRTWVKQQITLGPAPTATASPGAGQPPSPTPAASTTPASAQEDLVAVVFKNRQYGWVAGQRRGTIFSTQDGGRTWQAGLIPYPAEPDETSLLTVTEFIPTEDGSRASAFIGGRAAGNILYDASATPGRARSDGRRQFRVYELSNVGSIQEHSLLSSLRPNAASFSPSEIDFPGCPCRINHLTFIIDSQPKWILAVGDGGRIFIFEDNHWREVSVGITASLHSVMVYSEDLKPGLTWIVGDGGTILHSSDGGQTWRQQYSGTRTRLNGLGFLDKQTGWAVGHDGLILGTSDGGENWVRLTRESRAPQPEWRRSWPPWYYASWLVVGLLLVPAVRRPRKEEPQAEESVADVLVSDRPLEVGDPDPLEFRSLAFGLSRFLRNEKTVPPLTIAITGEWGTGKSSLMNLLRADLRGWKFRPVWFNAWHHQKEEHLLASLLQNIRLQAVPRWWTPRGVSFRAQLLRLRGARHWLPVLIVLFVSAALLAYAYRSRGDLTASFESLKHTVGALFSSAGGAATSTGQTASKAPLLAFLVSLVSLTVTIWKGVTAFGVNPASLLASTSGLRLRDLDAQTSFRQKFAAEFADVTRALGVRNMIIFIDDLDRCRPENVLEVLEAVNFLVTSGDCFVVLGMARERVERSVGNSFKDVAEAALADAGVDAKEGAAEADDKTLAGRVEAVRRQTEFARQYLDKLINIEVPVPQPTLDQARELLAGARAEAPREREGRQRLKSLGERFGLLLAAVAVLLLGWFWGSARLAELLQPAATPTPPPAATTPTPAPTPATTATPSRASDTASSPTPTATPAPTPDEDEARKATQTAELIQPTAARRSLTDYWALILFVALAAAACAWLLSRQPDLVVKDSKEFEDALRIWHPVIYSKLRTPRSIKRFMNRVRFLAMRQRRQTERKSYLSQLAVAVKRLFGVKPEETDEPTTEERIPESVLVALAAIQQWDAKHINDKDLFAGNIVRSPGNTSWLLVNAKIGDIREPLKNHSDKFKNDGFTDPERMAKYRESFLKLSVGVRVN